MVRSSVPFYRGTVQTGPGQAAVLGLRVVVKVEGYIGLHPPGGKTKIPANLLINDYVLLESTWNPLQQSYCSLYTYNHVQQHMFKGGGRKRPIFQLLGQKIVLWPEISQKFSFFLEFVKISVQTWS